MIGDIDENGGKEDDEEIGLEASSDDDDILDDSDSLDKDIPDVDNIGDLSVEINVEELVAKIESEDPEDDAEKHEIRKKLEAIEEKRSKELDSTYNFDLDDDV